MEKVQDIQFFSAQGHKSVVPVWESLFQHADRCLQGAVCFATRPGIDVLSSAARWFAQEGGFFVASVELPTDIDALADLHEATQGSVYIHLGYASPRTKDETGQDGYPLMHSKLFLAEGSQSCQLWVGSHNLTNSAMTGANLEAGVLITGDNDTAVMQDARQHLLACRDSAELFDPARIEEYKRIQRRKMRSPFDVVPLALVVIHAEANEEFRRRELPSVVHLSMKPTEMDRYFAIDRQVRLFLHPPGSLIPGQPANMSNAIGWMGRQTAIARTANHPRNQGVEGRFDDAHFQVTIEDLRSPPKAALSSEKLEGMTTQVVMRFTRELVPGSEAYSLRTGTAGVRMRTMEEEYSDEPLDRRLVNSFRPGSVRDGKMHFERITGIEPEIKIQAYMTTLQPLRLLGNAEVPVTYTPVEPTHPIDPYFFITKSVVRVGG